MQLSRHSTYGEWTSRLELVARQNLLELSQSSVVAAAQLEAGNHEFICHLGRLTIVCPPMLDALRKHPDWIEWLKNRVQGQERIVEVPAIEKEWEKWTSAQDADSENLDSLRSFKRREYLEISYWDVAGLISLEQTTKRLSRLADFVISKALLFCSRTLLEEQPKFAAVVSPPAGFCIFALGKLGGEELNYSSDVDLVFCRRASDSADELRFFTRLGERVVQSLSRAGPDGFLYRVDMRLRPHGETGPLVPTIAGLLTYYESWSEAWERQALIKIRPVAGDASLGGRFVDFVRQFAFARQMDDSSLEEVKRIKHRAEKEHSAPPGRIHLKQGAGGIRDIEFYVQYLQLIAGWRDTAVQTGSTLAAITALGQAKVLLEGEESQLSLAYLFYRTVEHRLQLRALTPAATLLVESPDTAQLAVELGFRDAEEVALDVFLRVLQNYRQRVRAILERILLSPGYLRLQEDQETLAQLLTDRTPRDRIRNILQRYGFQDVDKAWLNIRLIALGPEGRLLPPGERRIFLEFAFTLLEVLKQSFDPDQALHHLESFAAASGNRISFLRALASRRPHLARLANLLALSNLCRQILERHPEYFDTLARGIHLHEGRSREEMKEEILARSGQAPEALSKGQILRRMRQREMIRIAYRDLAGLASPLEISAELSDLASACVDVALDSTRLVRQPFEADQGETLCTIALGKLGSRQMHYSSDIDLMFLYEMPSGCADAPLRAEHQRLQDNRVERLLDILGSVTAEGITYSVDLRLRPEGSSGLLARSWESFIDYSTRFMQPWERMALVRSRLLAPAAFIRRWNDLIAQVVYEFHWTDEDFAAIRHLKRRIEAEKSREDRFSFDIKYGRGGIADLEFLVQFLQIIYGKAWEAVRVPGLAEAIPALHAAGALTAQECDDLLRIHHFQRLMENRLQMTEEWNVREVSRESPKLIRLAKSMGFEGNSPSDARRALIMAWEANARLVRGLTEKHFYGQ